MKFDVRKLKSKPPSNIKKDGWDLRDYKPRKSKFQNMKSLQGKSITKNVLKIFGEEFVKAVKEEAKRASSLGAGMPKTKEFYDSFSYEIVKGGKIRIRSNWRWVKKYLDRRQPYEMKWLKRKPGENKVIPLKTKGGDVIFRQAPLITAKGWTHPAISKFNFIEEGMRKGEERALRRAVTYFQTTNK